MIDDVAAPEVEAPATRRRRRVPWSFVVAGLAVAAAVGYLIVANTSATADYYMTIPQLYACHDCSTRQLRVAGVVEAGSIVRDDRTQVIRFTITEGRDALPVRYSGVVPDIFRPGITVVVAGRLAAGTFQAQMLLAKCPSRFQSATPPASQP